MKYITRTATPQILFVLALSLLSMGACDQASVVTPEPTTIAIAGATAMQPVLEALTDAYSQEHPDILFDIRGGGSTLGEEQVLNGKIDIAASTVLPGTPSEGGEDSGANAGVAVASDRLVYTPAGLDGIAVVVNERNPLRNLSVLQLRDLFSGRTLAWSDLSDADSANAGNAGEEESESEADEVLLISREDGSGTRVLFEERVMGDEEVSLTAVIMPSSADVVDYVATHPMAIGYVSRAYVRDTGGLSDSAEASQSGRVRVVALEEKLPELELLSNQDYYLTQPMFLVTAGQPSGGTRAFIDYVLSPAGQEIVGRYHARVR